jgi:hypothetical protein
VRLTARPDVYDTYWRFAAERQAIFLRRLRGCAKPWTEDPILRDFKFCNVYRASDRVSQYLLRNVIYSEEAADLSADDSFLRIVLFRLFSKEATWEVLESTIGLITRSTFQPERLATTLDITRLRGPIYTSAFILAPEGKGTSKHRSHLAVVKAMFNSGKLPRALAGASSLRDVYDALVAWPMIGPFLAYQLAIDLNYSEHLNFSENDFTMPGPGALRGLKKVFVSFGDTKPNALIHHMVDVQEDEFRRLGLEFGGLFGRPLHAIDCQGLFCEVDKYSRQAFPELRSERVRIKQKFTPAAREIELFYPPKWNLNDRLPRQMLSGNEQQSLSLSS